MKKLLYMTALMLFASQASAGLMCADRYAGNVDASLDCEVGSTNNNSATQVNLDNMLGFNDWTEEWRDDTGDPLPTSVTEFSMNFDLLGGTFTLQWGEPPTGDVMLVLKDGAGPNTDPTEYVGWLLDPGDYGEESYTFTSPFLNTNTGGLKQISHASFYYRDGGPGTTGCTENCSTVPVASSAALLPLGLFALALGRRKV